MTEREEQEDQIIMRVMLPYITALKVAIKDDDIFTSLSVCDSTFDANALIEHVKVYLNNVNERRGGVVSKGSAG